MIKKNKLLFTVITLTFIIVLFGFNIKKLINYFEKSTLNEKEVLQKHPLPNFTINYKKFTLENGLTIIVHEDHNTPEVSIHTIYKVGTKNDPIGKKGLTHFLEYLMFKGTQHYNDEYLKPFNDIGVIDINANVDYDKTYFYETVPTAALELALWMESDRMGYLDKALTISKLEKESKNIIAENNLYKNNPYNKLNTLVAQNIFPKEHPYYIGNSIENINDITLDDIKLYYKKYYGPNNAILVLSGDITYEDAKNKITKYFSSIEPIEQPETLELDLYKINSNKKQLFYEKVPQKILLKVWNVNAQNPENFVHTDILSMLLGKEENSYLYKILVDEKKLASSVKTFVSKNKLVSQLYIEVFLKPKAKEAEVENIINEEIYKLLQVGCSEENLGLVRPSYIVDIIRENETLFGKGRTLALGEFYYNDPSYYAKQLKLINNAVPEQINHAIRNNFLDNGSYTIVIAPVPNYQATIDYITRSKLPSVKNEDLILQFPKFQKFRLSNGLNVILLQRGKAPLLEMNLQFYAGYAADDFYNKSGIEKMTMSMLFDGTKNKSIYELEKDLDYLGSRIFTWSNIETSNITISTLNNRVKSTLDVLTDMLVNPLFSKRYLEINRSNILDKIRFENSESNSIIMRALPLLLYPKDSPYSNPWTGYGTLDSVKSITHSEVINFYKNYLIPSNAILTAVGNISVEDFKKILESTLGKWKGNIKKILETDYKKDITNLNKGKIFIIDKPEAKQAVITAAQLIPPSTSKYNTQFLVANNIIVGNFFSRLNMNLRENKHWTHRVYNTILHTNENKIYMITTSVPVENAVDSIKAINSEYTDILKTKPITEKELQDAKIEFIRTLMQSLQNNNSLLNRVDYFSYNNRPTTYLTNLQNVIKNITLNNANNVLKNYLNPKEFIWLVIGDSKLIKEQVNSLGWRKPEIIKLIE